MMLISMNAGLVLISRSLKTLSYFHPVVENMMISTDAVFMNNSWYFDVHVDVSMNRK